jgi:hypothetical protein
MMILSVDRVGVVKKYVCIRLFTQMYEFPRIEQSAIPERLEQDTCTLPHVPKWILRFVRFVSANVNQRFVEIVEFESSTGHAEPQIPVFEVL